MATVGGRIKYYRRLNNLRQKDIYEKIGIDKATYIRYESDTDTNNNLDICNKICVVIGIDPKLVYDDYMAFIASDYSATIKDFRRRNKLSHRQFGELIGMNHKISSRWERNICEPSRTSYEKLKELFKEYEEEI